MNNQPPSSSNRRTVNGVVTKLVGETNNYGFINNEIFFPQTHVIGGPASVGDQVFAECEFSENLPIKWNATSVKILNKTAGGQAQQANLRNDQPQQAKDSPSTNQQFGSPGQPAAVTYQQHRQQRQRMLDNKQPDVPNKPPPTSDLTTKLLEQQNNQSGEFFGQPNQNRPFNQQQPPMDAIIQPFQDAPMGPPNFTYTSQLGSAFVQNQFVPQPFLAQQPPPMLPQQQPPPPPQHLLQQTQPMLNKNQNQRHNMHNKSNIPGNNSAGGSNRFNNQGDKNDRQNQRRNMNNRNDNKFERTRNNESDYGSNQKHMSNDRSSKRNDNREGSLSSKRDDSSSRPSPTPQLGRSNTSSDRGTKIRRHYEVQNIPKSSIIVNMNAYNMKHRCPQSLHVPSDLKEVILNKYFRLDVKNIPKPLLFNIEQPTKEQGLFKDSETTTIDQTDKETSSTTSESLQTDQSESIKKESKPEQPTPPTSSRSEQKLFHKYGVKVILLSLPEMKEIYKRVFGQNFDSYSSDSKYQTKLTETISLLCNKGSNNGYSLIGGKFDPVLDGYVEGQTNELERHGRKPDLLSTCKRVVLEQTGLDLGECQSWTHISTFVYNNKSDYFSFKASVEYSYIYMPQLWTLLSDTMNQDIIKKEREVCSEQPMDTCDGSEEKLDVKSTEVSTSESAIESTTEEPLKESSEEEIPKEVTSVDNEKVEMDTCKTEIPSTVPTSLANVSDLKVSDLKNELDSRGIKYKANLKKAELVALLQDNLETKKLETEAQVSTEHAEEDAQTVGGCAESTEATELKSEPEHKEESVENNETVQAADDDKEEGEIKAGQSDESSEGGDAASCNEAGVKRKAEDAEIGEDVANKKVCPAEEDDGKTQRYNLIKEAFTVRARDEQQQLTLVSLHDISLAARHDQFELSVTGVILKEALVKHLSEYILTALIEDSKNRSSGSAQSTETSSCNDTNNNETSKTTAKEAKPAAASNQILKGPDQKTGVKELPVDRYITLAFTLFDSTHMGYVYFEDLNKLFNNTGHTMSKRALTSLLGDNERFNYRQLPDLSPKLPPTYLYEFPRQFYDETKSGQPESNSAVSSKMVEYKGVTYDIEKLVKEVREAETLRVSLVDRFNYAIENSDKQAEEIHVLEVSQKSLSKAIKMQNDEICELKRERDAIKKKFDVLRKGIKSSIGSLSDLIKDDK